MVRADTATARQLKMAADLFLYIGPEGCSLIGQIRGKINHMIQHFLCACSMLRVGA